MADRYVMAWSSGDADQIAALYSAHATLSDSTFGVNVTGPGKAGSFADDRLGSGEITLTVERIYGVRIGGSLPGTKPPWIRAMSLEWASNTNGAPA